MLDFTELPSDGIKFEQLIRELFVKRGYETVWTGVGTDLGRDLIVTEKLVGPLSTKNRKWIVSCKHNAHSKRAVGLKDLGNVAGDCTSIQAEGYLLVCSTYPSSSVVLRLEEITKSNDIVTKIWDAVEIEKQLSYPETFSLFKSFFPSSSIYNEWKIYNAFSPSFWAANYKQYFFYMSSRNSTTFPDLPSMEAIIKTLESLSLQKSHIIRPRNFYYDDKFCVHTVYFDYLFPDDKKTKKPLTASELRTKLLEKFPSRAHRFMNFPDWDVRYISVNYDSDNFEFDHRRFYEPYMGEYEKGQTRDEFLHTVADREDFYAKHNIRVLSAEDIDKMFKK